MINPKQLILNSISDNGVTYTLTLIAVIATSYAIGTFITNSLEKTK
jgi:hypothetical protein